MTRLKNKFKNKFRIMKLSQILAICGGAIFLSNPAMAIKETKKIKEIDDNMVMILEENIVMLPDFTPEATSAKPSYISNSNTATASADQGYVESGINLHKVSKDQGDWFGQFIQGEVKSDEKNIWRGYLQHQKSFKDDGYFASLGNVHNFDDRWFSDLSGGFGSSVAFLPKYRADAAINHRFLAKRNLVGTLGTNWIKSNDQNKNNGIFLGATYYFAAPWIIQLGARGELSDPGNKIASSGFGAITYGYNNNFYLTMRGGYAREAYQLIGRGRNINNAFNSKNAGINWRQWIEDDWGFNLGGEFYRNPSYHRLGGTVSLFKEF